MRLLLVGAFPHPHHQGSQVYFQEQAIALRDAGADVTLLTYGSPMRLRDERISGRTTREEARAHAGFDHRTSPPWTSPHSLRSGPNWSKPLADLGLMMTLRNAIASSTGHDAFDAVLTHHAEASVAALIGLRGARPPIVYCVHTLLGRELPAYLNGRKRSKNHGVMGSSIEFDSDWRTISRGLGQLGNRIDRWIAARVDGWIALTQTSERVMREAGSAPGALIPPPCPDPEGRSEPLDPTGAARRHSLEPGAFFLYSGNLDAYQELDLLEGAAREMTRASDRPDRLRSRRPGQRDHRRGSSHRRPRLVVATHQPLDATWWLRGSGIDFVRVESAHEMQSLLAAARGSLVMRRAEGGFPIKIVNSLAVGTPVLAFREAEWGLEHERNALICSPDRPGPTLARAIERLANDDALAKRLSAGARRLYLERHQPESIARQTVDQLETVMSTRPPDR